MTATVITLAIGFQTGLRKAFSDIALLRTESFLSKIPEAYNSSIATSEVVTIDLALKHVILNRIIIYRKSEAVEPLAQLLDNY